MSNFGLPPEEASIVSVTDRVTKVALNAPASAVHFLGDVAAFVVDDLVQVVSIHAPAWGATG